MIATYSSLAMVTSAVLYLLAMMSHAAEWAAARSPATAEGGRAETEAAATAGQVGVLTRPADTEVISVREDRFWRIGITLTVIAAACHLAGVVLRGVAAERFPWGNMYEFVTSALAAAALFYLFLVWRLRWRWLGLPVTLLLAVGQGLAVTVFYVDVAPLVPALHSVWFVVHIVAAVITAAAFNLAAIAAILYLIKTRAIAKGRDRGYLARVPDPARLDAFSYRVTAFAFPVWTFVIAAGAIWADYAWGRFWGWDPKETWSLVTWVVYAAYLHARATAGWRGRRAAWLSILGVVAFWFNFIGVNLLMSGLHSYAGI